MDNTKPDTIQRWGESGVLGKITRSYQKTLKLTKSMVPGGFVSATAYGTATVQISFDGRVYHDVMLLKESTLEVQVAARAIRIKVKRSVEKCHYTLSLSYLGSY